MSTDPQRIGTDKSITDLYDRVRALERRPAGAANIDGAKSAIYESDIIGFSGPAIAAGGNSILIKFGFLNTDAPGEFFLKGASSPYFAQVPAGFYHWEVELAFQAYPRMLAVGADVTNPADYGQFFAFPVWSAASVSPHADIVEITPGETVEYVPATPQFDGYMQLGNPVDDMEIQIGLNNVQNSDAIVTLANLILVRLGDFLPDESSNIVP